ncbi:MAG: hypothetical protein Q7V56_08860 [Gammaproteobacteria bacterium]|nr:hypothetical protein [Gammaproteobacteria bacterium]
MPKLFEELKRRKVVRVAGVYAVVAWLLIQVANNIVPALQLPAWTSTLIVVLLLIGFPIALVLAWAFEVSPDGLQRQGAADAPRGDQIPVAQSANTKLLYATFALVLVVAIFQIGERFMGNRPTLPAPSGNELSAGLSPLRAALPLGELERFRNSRLRSYVALSPDGRWLAYTARLNGTVNLQLRDLVTGETRTVVEGTLEQLFPVSPSFSPSGEHILYFVNGSGETHVVPRAGGRPQALAVNTGPYTVAGSFYGAPAWLSEDSVVFTNDGGVVETLHIPTGEIVTLDIPKIDGEANIYPRLMEDGPWLLYTVLTSEGIGSARLDAFNMSTGEVKNLVANGFNGHYLRSGVLVYMRDNGLWAVRVDGQQMQISGGERLIEDRVEANLTRGSSSYALSDNGRLVYLEGGDVAAESSGADRWVLSSRNGERLSLDLPANAFHPVFSPDGGQLAVTVQQNASALGTGASEHLLGYIALYQLADGSLTRRSFTGAAFRPKWTPDGKQLVYGMLMDNAWGLWITAADGSGQPRQLLTATEPVWPESITPDGDGLIYGIGLFPPDGIMRLHLLSLQETAATGQPLLEFGDRQFGAVISPDGRFVAYTGNELNRDTDDRASIRDLIVRPFPNVNDGQWQIASSVGNAVWDSSGKSMYFLRGSDIYRAPADPENGFRQSAPEPVFDLTASISGGGSSSAPGFAVSPDGQRFVYRELAAESSFFAAEMTHAVLVDNWIEKVRQLLPVTN